MNAARLPLPFCLLACAAWPAWAAPLSLEGNAHLPRKKIESALSLPERPSSLSEEDWGDWVDETALAITGLYGEIGYLDAAVKVERAGADSSLVPPGKDAVSIHVQEGDQYRFGRVAIEAPPGSPAVADANRLLSRPGRPFEKDLVFRDRRRLLNAYGDAGFLHARFKEHLDPDTTAKTVALTFEVTPGPAVVFDTLAVRNRREEDTTGAPGITRARVFRSLLGLERGDTASLSDISAYERKLKSTRVFNYVRLRDSLLENGRSALILVTEERVPGEADGSVFLETQYGAGVSLNWSHGNVLGHLHEARFGGAVAQRKQNLYLGYGSPLLFGSLLRFDDDLVATWYQDGGLQRGAGFYGGDFEITNSGKLSRVFSSWARGVSAIELAGLSERIDSAHVDRAFNLNFINTAFLSFLDVPADPSRGARWALTWGNGGSIVSGGRVDLPVSNRHNWIEIESAYFLPLHEHVKLGFRLDGGRFFGSGEENSERFFLGGPRSVRSYGWREICPDKDGQGHCRTENMQPIYCLGSFEIRARPFAPLRLNPESRMAWLRGLQVVPFTDYGKVREIGKSATPAGTGVAFGLGFRYSILSIFNFRLDYAVDDLRRTHEQWILDLAQAF